MAKSKTNKKKIYKRLQNKYRMVIMNDDTFEAKFSMILSPLNLFTWGGVIFFSIVVLVALVISYTSIREYIPGYADVNTKRMVAYATMKADSIEHQMRQRESYFRNLQNVMKGELPEAVQVDMADTTVDYGEVVIEHSVADSLLREKMETEERFNLSLAGSDAESNLSEVYFFTPMQGVISEEFNSEAEHYGIDIVAPNNEAVKATLGGTIMLAAWTSETGHVIQVQHLNNLISIYKHNSVLLKRVGDYVKAGEVIAIIGESGELTTGPHLHFELWFRGNPIDPRKYMIFE